jgi:ubiquinone biosynthesis protein COQ4
MGSRILDERRDLLPVLSDRQRLLALPPETLGHHYARFMEAEQISADGLAAASLVMREGEAEDLDTAGLEAESFGTRLRDMHDLWHVVTGYSRDVLGELALLAFTYQQTRDPGIGYIVRNVEKRMRRGGNAEISGFLRQASKRGRGAAFLPVADWEALLERPLEDVRDELQVGPPSVYEQRRTPAGEAAAAAAASA